MAEVIPHWLTKQAALNPDKTAIELENGQQLTFAELQERSESCARKLAAFGVEQGAKVAVLSHNHLDMAVAVHALSYLKAVVVLLNTKLSTKELQAQLTASEAMLLLTTEYLQEPLSFHSKLTFTALEEAEETAVCLAEELPLEHPFTMMFTSGTTGNPKRVVHTYGNHWWSAIGSTLNLGLHDDDKWLLTLPMYHVGGLSILIRSVITGMEVYLMEKYDRRQLFYALDKKGVTIASIVTVMLNDLLDMLETETLPQHVRCLLLGGSAVPEPSLRKVKEKGLPLFQSYGMTETSSQIVTLSARDALRKVGSSGKPLFPAQVKIGDKDADGIGEIIVKGPMVFHGYENQTAANTEKFTGGWFKTGDLGYIDKDGFLYVMDRRTDLIISGGENVYPQEIENLLFNVDMVQEAAVVAKPDAKWGHVPAAFIVTDDNTLTKAQLIEALRPNLASFKLPKEIHFIDELPRNATNKVMRHKLKEQLQ